MKKFLIIGNINAVAYKEVFPFIKENKMWLGCSLHATKCNFIVSNDYDSSNTFIDKDGIKKAKINNAVWFTNLDHANRHEPIDLYKRYTPEEYPKYDNYDAIEVSKTCEIPMDYDGVMGVPITFLDKYCPEQFEIIGDACNGSDHQWDYFKPIINGKFIYKRILIKKIS